MRKRFVAGAAAVSLALSSALNAIGQHLAIDKSPQRDRRSLKDAVGNRLKLGVGVSHLVVEQPEDAALIRQHFQILTPENCMKPQSIHPSVNQWATG